MPGCVALLCQGVRLPVHTAAVPLHHWEVAMVAATTSAPVHSLLLMCSTGATGTSQSFEAASSLLLCSAAAHATVTAAGCTKHSRTCADICLCAGRTCLQGVRVLYHRMKRLCTTMLATIHLVYCHVVQAAAHCKALHERCCSELGPAFCSWHIAILCSPHLCIAYATSGQHRMTAVEEPLICPIRLQF